jgi:hypothetical protein
MVDRVAVGTIVHGDGDNRVILGPGERFNTDTLKWDEGYVKELDARGVIRAPRDDTGRAPATAGPGEEAVTENRAPTRAPAAAPAEERHITRRRPAETDL